MFPMLRSFTHSSRNTNTEAPIYIATAKIGNLPSLISSDQFNSWCLRRDFAFPNCFFCVFVLLLLPLTLPNHFFCVFALLLQQLTLKPALPRSSICAARLELGVIAWSHRGLWDESGDNKQWCVISTQCLGSWVNKSTKSLREIWLYPINCASDSLQGSPWVYGYGWCFRSFNAYGCLWNHQQESNPRVLERSPDVRIGS